MKESNGCGPAWLPKWLTGLLFNWFFEASCIKHDEGYAQGGDEVRRFECDWKFFEAMKQDVKCLPWFSKIFAAPLAVVFFVLVRVFGWLYFRYQDR